MSAPLPNKDAPDGDEEKQDVSPRNGNDADKKRDESPGNGSNVKQRHRRALEEGLPT